MTTHSDDAFADDKFLPDAALTPDDTRHAGPATCTNAAPGEHLDPARLKFSRLPTPSSKRTSSEFVFGTRLRPGLRLGGGIRLCGIRLRNSFSAGNSAAEGNSSSWNSSSPYAFGREFVFWGEFMREGSILCGIIFGIRVRNSSSSSGAKVIPAQRAQNEQKGCRGGGCQT